MFEYAAKPRRASPVPKEEKFARVWKWHSQILFEKCANGRLLRLYLLLMHEHFDAYEKPFNVTSEMVERAKVKRRFKAEVLRALVEWGLAWVDFRDSKNPRIAMRRYQGRGTNPFLE